jgi:glyoxylase-like metal-dependent hydrolase (beta-lactamase superfamily II)
MQEIATGTSLIDLIFLGYPEAIGPCLLESGGELALVDCGPSNCLPTLRKELAGRGLSVRDLTSILLTHIHLDHAGAAGSLVRENPKLRVYVHEKGATHLADPAKLLRSAERLYHGEMHKLFGDFIPVPAENIYSLAGGETLQLGPRKIEVLYTPGHASHHVSYFDQSTGIAFTGDTTGLRYPGSPFVAPLTPPPDIDLDAWKRSLPEIARRKPAKLCLTHFGPAEPVQGHLDQVWEGLQRWAEFAAHILRSEPDERAQLPAFLRRANLDFEQHMRPEDAKRYAMGSNPTLSWFGLSRYWTKRAAANSATQGAS